MTELSILLGPASSLPLSLPSTEWDPSWMPPGALLRADPGVVELHVRERVCVSDWSRGSLSGRWCSCVTARAVWAGLGLAIGALPPSGENSIGGCGCLKKDQIQQDAELWRKALEVDEPLLLGAGYAQDLGGHNSLAGGTGGRGEGSPSAVASAVSKAGRVAGESEK
ncbi:MAG UNVERIFIED_CONTAM: hypothetical protein LVR18_42145 [Planctomycetaceae bacterium]|jgi:hypothetical protein